MNKAYAGTRNICDRMATKLYNAMNAFYMEDEPNNALGIVDVDTADEMDEVRLILERVASTGYIQPNEWNAVEWASKTHNELQYLGGF